MKIGVHPKRKEDNAMTREEKIAWLNKATSEELLNQLKWTVITLSKGSIEQQITANEDYEIVTAEILNRMGK